MQSISTQDEPGFQADPADRGPQPIHQIGTVQSNGFLVVAAQDWTICRISANATQWVGRPAAGLLGRSLHELLGAEAVHAVRNSLTALRDENSIDRIIGIALFEDGQLFDVAVHLSHDLVVLECEPCRGNGRSGAIPLVRALIGRLQASAGFPELCREATRQLKALTGFDRVMVYRFHPDGSGEVVGEAARAGLEPFLGRRYPAVEIPRQVRTFHERNWLRLITDIDSEPVGVLSLPGLDEVPDLSMSMLHSVSPVHLDHLRRLGARSSMSVSILVRGRVWGLLVCQHPVPRTVDFEHRTASELLSQIFAMMLDGRERDLDVQHEARARELHRRIMATVSPGTTAFDVISGLADSVGDMIPCDGIAIWVDRKTVFSRSVPAREDFIGLLDFLDGLPGNSIHATSELVQAYPPARLFADRAAGLLAVPLSRTGRDYVVFFRRETPAPHESPDGRSAPWAEPELRLAESLRITLLEIVLRLAVAAEKERQEAAERQELLIAELNHRVRNILGLVHGLVAQSRPGAVSVEAFAGVLGGRIHALARAHDQITMQHWGPGMLRALVVAEAAAYVTGGSEDRVRCNGPPVLLQPSAFSTMALVMHELMTNSAKHGALSSPRGTVDVGWSLDPVGSLVIDWIEQGGPVVRAPSRRGFGSTIIERMIPHDLKGEADIRHHPAGLRARLTIPRHFVTAGETAAPEAAAVQPWAEVSLSGDVLLLDDNIIIALDAEDMLRKLGARHVGIAGTIDEAMRLIEASPPSFAVLDINLGGGNSFAFASRLRSLGISYCFATGYGENIPLPPEHADVPVARKPYSAMILAKAIADAR